MASKREVVVATENYLRSKGYNNSTGKYDRVIMGVKSLLGETLLAYGSPEFERAIQQETERMLKKYVKDSAMEYDPVMCMMVPKKANDASRVIKQRNGYTLGINGQGTIYLAFPGETENNPHMYLGKENDKNLNDAKVMFEKFASTRDSASMIYDEVMAMMKPVTTKDQKAVDYPNWSSAMNHMRDIERKLDTARSNALKELGTAKKEIDNLLGSSDITADVEKMLVAEFDRLYKKVNG